MESEAKEPQPLGLSCEQIIHGLLLTISGKWRLDCDCPVTPELLRAGLEASLNNFHDELVAAIPKCLETFFDQRNAN